MFLVYLILILMLIKFYNTFTSGKCYSDALLNGKVAIVTCANDDGVEYATALDLAGRGAKVILACPKHIGYKAVANIVKQTKNNNVKCLDLDFTSLTSVRQFVEDFKRDELKLDILIISAEVRDGNDRKTDDGLIECVQINYFAQFLLTILLVPLLKRSEPSRVIIVSSNLHRFGTINVMKPISSWQTYCNSKLCNVLFSNELSRRLDGTGVVVNCLHPGYIKTANPSTIMRKIQNFILLIFFKSPIEGAQTSIHLAVSDDCDQLTGKYFSDCSESVTSANGKNEKMAKQLWTLSENLVKLTAEECI